MFPYLALPADIEPNSHIMGDKTVNILRLFYIGKYDLEFLTTQKQLSNIQEQSDFAKSQYNERN